MQIVVAARVLMEHNFIPNKDMGILVNFGAVEFYVQQPYSFKIVV